MKPSFSRNHIEQKLSRLKNGRRPRVLDLFSGCGGLSVGFQAAGFLPLAAIEIDPHAIKSYVTNFHSGLSFEHRRRVAQPRDIVEVEPEELLQDWNYDDRIADAADVIVGGPPCQAFARVGRAKLREVASHPEAYLKDPRGNLYLRFLHYVRELQPLALLMENVPDVLNYGGHNIAEEMCEVLSELGYSSRYTFLNAVHYGVPEMRERVFLLAYANELGAEPSFPQPTHFIELPRGYESSRQVALQTVNTGLFVENCYYAPAQVCAKGQTEAAVTAEEALGDLPRITLHLNGKLKRGARRF